MQNPSLLCHYINARASKDYITKTLKEFKNQGWEFVSIISNSDQVIDGYFFQRSS